MIILSVDFGTRRVGLAISDERETLSLAVGVVGPVPEEVAAAAREHGAQLIVVGLPKNMDGTEGAAARRARRFGGALTPLTGLPVQFFDERLTSDEAERRLAGTAIRWKKKRDRVNVVAAQVILEGFLESRHR